jgi:hypothetical protein
MTWVYLLLGIAVFVVLFLLTHEVKRWENWN